MNPFEQEPVFHEPWEAQAFAMAVKLNEAGHFTWSEWAETLGAQIAAHPREAYYESWLSALEGLVERIGLMSPEERQSRVEDWDRAAHTTPHGKPVELNRP